MAKPSMTLGGRLYWPHPGFLHWDLRKAFTIPGYEVQWKSRIALGMSTSVENIIQESLKIYNKNKEINERLSISFFDDLDIMYHVACKKLLSTRFSFYTVIYPANKYRRTSFDFKMQSFDDPLIGAFVESEEPTLVKLKIGTVYAVEDACHTLMALWDKPCGIEFSVDSLHMTLAINSMSLPYDKVLLRFLSEDSSIRNESFLKYTHYSPNGTLSHSGIQYDKIYIPESIKRSFLLVSPELDRQLLADNFSIMSILWIIAHEDAHNYLGHLSYFQRMGVSEQDQIFNELITGIDDEVYVNIRKSAELEADTCAIMRSVDYCFDNEFLGIITDWFSVANKSAVFQDHKRSDELGTDQRLILLRLISISCVIPLILFEASLCRLPATNLDCYPTFAIRSLNVIFTVASRAMDVSINNPSNLVGMIMPVEMLVFFELALQDIYEAYNIIFNEINTQVSRELPNDFKRLSLPLYKAFLASHGQRFNVDKSILGNETIIDLVIQRYDMYCASIKIFAESKREVNHARIEKVEQDISFAMMRIAIARNAFPFLE